MCERGSCVVAPARHAGRVQSVPIHLPEVIRGLGELRCHPSTAGGSDQRSLSAYRCHATK